MSKKYNDIIDRITVDETMKKRILLNIENIDMTNNNAETDKEFKVKFTPHRSKNNIVILAASFMIIICSIATQSFKNIFKATYPQILENTQNANLNESNKDDVVKDSTVASTEKIKEIDKNNQINSTTLKPKDAPITIAEQDKKMQSSHSKLEEKKVEQPTPKVQATIPQAEETAPKMQTSTSNVENSNSKNNNKSSNFIEQDSISLVDKSPMTGRIVTQEFDNITDLINSINFQFEIPKVLPENFKLKSMSVVSQELISIIYSNSTDIIEYRIYNGDSNLSGDLSEYKSVKNIKLDMKNVTLKGNNGLINITTWVEGRLSYCILSSNGIKEEDVLNMVKSNKTP